MESTSLRLPGMVVDLLNFNQDFLLLRSESDRLAALGPLLLERHFDFVSEVIVTEQEICLKLRRSVGPVEMGLLQQLDPQSQTAGKIHEWPVHFNDSKDWINLEKHTQLSREAFIEQLLSVEFRVAMYGFLPGFLYLRGLPPSLQVPRKTTPATRVQAGSLAIGGPYLGVYSIDSPGGWQVFGETLPLFDPQRLPPVALNPGDRVRLRRVDSEAFIKLLHAHA